MDSVMKGQTGGAMPPPPRFFRLEPLLRSGVFFVQRFIVLFSMFTVVV